MAAAPGPTLTITGPDGRPQPVSFIPLPPTAAELASAPFFTLEDDISSDPDDHWLPDRPPVTSANMTIKEILAIIRRKLNITINSNRKKWDRKNWMRERLEAQKKRRIPTDELVAGGLVKKMK
ncbi:hypothetical protein H9Q69_002485 [Fusarium xylarioides]|uniref:Uncharacterized protein n=1 Tax=Fusarium xylarioides TaxID=221167 RepID=A0A9P7INB5_9HYPO|nr:hypothetical protein H9Q70_010070 [Fusarium xylarioides]KAG5767906.1 hypothetical protein H9Q72_004395 [Fusarium xylarioides]KAG5776332.1 hypothetical protein H9Q73_009992 [Fusarium xylarioides]KAG5798497.1 hypothetical protein H9Q69_002485 [Fusarium xylarioides]KAG5810773.1 hypothetical protein H9Q71_005279 [Fusarium xylarioides]